MNEQTARIKELEQALIDIMTACKEGRVCDDVAWFDDITTLHDFCYLAVFGPQEKAHA